MESVGIDIGGSSVKLAAVRHGEVLWTAQSQPYSRPAKHQLLDAIRKAVESHAIDADAAGICVPGLLDESGRMVKMSVNVPGLKGVALEELVQSALGKSIQGLTVVNDAVAAGTDLVVSKGLTGRVLTLALGTGVGMSVLDDGKPLPVEGTSPGHIGQADVSLDTDSPIGPDGGRGSLEAYIGVPALIRQYGSMEAFFWSAKCEDAPLRALARAIRICHAIYRPNHVVLAGGVGIRLKRLLPELKAAIDANLTGIAREGWTLSCGDHDFHAAIGAARLAAAAVND